MGMLLVVAAVVAAISASPLGGQLGNRMRELVCKIGGFDCSAATQLALSQCVVADSDDKLTINGSVNVRLVRVKLPMSGGVGPALAKALGVGKLDFTAKVGSVPQVTFLLPNDDAANTFARQIKDSAIAAAAGPILSHFIGKSIHIDIPPVES